MNTVKRGIIALTALSFATTVVADEPTKLRVVRQAYESLKRPSEAQRVEYVTHLVRLRESFTRADEKALDAIDAEIVKHPMPISADIVTLSKCLVGRWQSPRHPYFYHSDGTWSSDEDAPADTGGKWRIEGNRFFQDYRNDAPNSGEIIILLTSTDFVRGTDTEHPYYLRRGKAFPWR